ncbi:transglutaminase [Roseivivax halodurans JCM 10272]|uniref:Transglutaminase n=1 Tax=Roseivivax halodurans JCM 10272 TaxID=1449350 RepID=X7EDQ4_9RHOB|nr:transglutaminase family protein [Roseivivax halodurans]ETX13258.1 transglutaminase [Roseivivax halodurans JCM 10272]
MPRLTITHTTEFRYRGPVAHGPHRLMLRPRETHDLKLLAFDLEISPQAQVEWSQDVAGNAVATATFATSSDVLRISACATIELSAPAWPVFPISAHAAQYPFRYSDEDWTDLGALASPQYVDEANRLAAWVEGFVMQRPTDTLSLLKDLSNGVTAQIAYQLRDEEGTQGPLETLDRGRGTCRDLAVLFAEAVRVLGFGARLVSGYLYDPDKDLVGSSGGGSTHAWTEVYVPGGGWIAFDPTNAAMGSVNLIPVAVARNIGQVAPITGSFAGEARDFVSMGVSVSVERL